MCGRSVKKLLEYIEWENALSIEKYLYPNLIKVFYSNMKLFTTQLDRIVTNRRGVPIEFDVGNLNKILGTEKIQK